MKRGVLLVENPPARLRVLTPGATIFRNSRRTTRGPAPPSSHALVQRLSIREIHRKSKGRGSWEVGKPHKAEVKVQG